MNWLAMSEHDILKIADPIMDNLMQASTNINYSEHIQDFSDNMKNIVTQENFVSQCETYQAELGYFKRREFVAVFRKRDDVKIFWRQWYSKSEDEFIAFIHLMHLNKRIEVVNALVS